MDIKFNQKLIEAIKKRPVLYSKCHPFIRNYLWQQEAWREIEQELNKDVPCLKNRWKYLKSTYTQFKRYQRIANNNPTPKRIKLSYWTWGKYMSFLEDDYVDETQDPLNKTKSSNQQIAVNHETQDPLKETRSSDQQFAASEEDSDNSANNDTPISPPHREETVKIEPTFEPRSALVENTKRRYSRRRINSDPKGGEEEDNDDDTPLSSLHREETVKIKPSPKPSSELAANTKKRYSGRRRIDSDPKVEKDENEESRTMPNIKKKTTSTFDNSCNSEKVEVKCDTVDLLFLGYADTFKKLSRKKQLLVKFEIAKAFLQAELVDISDS